MAIRRDVTIELNLKSGETITLSGDEGNSVYSQMQQHKSGVSLTNGITFKNAEGKNQFIEFHCICGFTVIDVEKTELPDPECDPLDCLV